MNRRQFIGGMIAAASTALIGGISAALPVFKPRPGPHPTLSEIVAATMRNRRGRIADIIVRNNELFDRLAGRS